MGDVDRQATVRLVFVPSIRAKPIGYKGRVLGCAERKTFQQENRLEVERSG
jgi:hypothetical protein